MQKDTHRKRIQFSPMKEPQAISPALPVQSSQHKLNSMSVRSANKLLAGKKRRFVFFKAHLHLFSAICSLSALAISYYLWKDETQWVIKWTIIYAAFALFYWSIKPVISWILEKWNK